MQRFHKGIIDKVLESVAPKDIRILVSAEQGSRGGRVYRFIIEVPRFTDGIKERFPSGVDWKAKLAEPDSHEFYLSYQGVHTSGGGASFKVRGFPPNEAGPTGVPPWRIQGEDQRPEVYVRIREVPDPYLIRNLPPALQNRIWKTPSLSELRRIR